MDYTIPWRREYAMNGSLTKEADGGASFLCLRQGLDYMLYDRAEDGDLHLESYACLLVTPQVLESHSVCFQLAFHEKGQAQPTLRAIFGLLPGTEVPVPFSFAWLNSQRLFPPRTLGRLKMTLFGKPVRPCDIEQIHLQTTPAPGAVAVHFQGCRLLASMPEITLPRAQKIDELGQWMPKDWPGKVASRAACNTLLQALDKQAVQAGSAYTIPHWDAFGGYTKKRFTKTGWFHVQRDERRFWLVDPEGNAFISTGVDCIGPGVDTRVDPVAPWLDGKVHGLLEQAKQGRAPADPAFSGQRGAYFYDYGKANLMQAFGQEDWRQAWARITKAHLKTWGVNTIGNWSSLPFIRAAGMPYVLPADSVAPQGFPHTEQCIFRDFPDVFADAYTQTAQAYAAGLAPYRDDPNLVGYFMRNEPEWAFVYDLNLAEEMLANPAQLASKDWMLARLQEQYGSITELNTAWHSGFSSFDELRRPLRRAASLSPAANGDLLAYTKALIARYVELPAKALRQVDPHHLNLGMRYAYITDETLLAGASCFDVFSINSYQRSPFDQVEQVGKLLDKPVMVGEFHHGALDRGLTAHGIRGVTTQAERGAAYRYYMEQAAQSPYFVGAHYFQYNDQSPLGRFDGENYQIGLVDVCMQAYADMAAGMRACHEALYPVALGETPPFARVPEEVEPIHY